MFVNPEGNIYYRSPLEGSRLKRLSRNLAAARDASDEYVWDLRGAMPLVERAGQGQAMARAAVEEHGGQGPPLGRGVAGHHAGNRPGSRRPGGRPRGNRPTQSPRSGSQSRRQRRLPSTADWRDAAAGLVVVEGREEPHRQPCLGRDRRGRIGLRAQVAWAALFEPPARRASARRSPSARVPGQRGDDAGITIRWQTSEGQWTHEADDSLLAFEPAGGDWKTAFGVVTVPSRFPAHRVARRPRPADRQRRLLVRQC